MRFTYLLTVLLVLVSSISVRNQSSELKFFSFFPGDNILVHEKYFLYDKMIVEFCGWWHLICGFVSFEYLFFEKLNCFISWMPDKFLEEIGYQRRNNLLPYACDLSK